MNWKLMLVWCVAVSLLWQGGVFASGGGEWSEKDSRLANRYIELLGRDPSVGRTVDLLWDLYKGAGAEETLLGHFAGQAEGSVVARLVYGHLLRKGGRLEEARVVYAAVLEVAPGYEPAVEAAVGAAVEGLDFDAAVGLLVGAGGEGAGYFLRLAGLQVQRGDVEAAGVALRAALEADGGDDVGVLREVAAGWLRLGELGEAAGVLEVVAGLVSGAERPGVWLELARVREIGGDFDGAERVLREGLEGTYFAGEEHRQFFRRLVRLHERAGTLGVLEDSLRVVAEGGGEGALVGLGEFYAMTLRPEERAGVLRILVGRFPGRLGYGLDLVRVLRGLDRDDEAGVVLGGLVERAGVPVPVALVIEGAVLDVRAGDGGKAEAAVGGLLEAGRVRVDVVEEFARGQNLVGLLEVVLRRRVEMEPGDRDACWALARFLVERMRGGEALGVVVAYAGGDSERLRGGSELMVVLDRLEEAGVLARAAVDADGGGVEGRQQLAEVLFLEGASVEAVAELEGVLDGLDWVEDRERVMELDGMILRFFQMEAQGDVVGGEGVAPGERIGEFLPFLPKMVEDPRGREVGVERPRVPAAARGYGLEVGRRAEAGEVSAWRAAWWAVSSGDFEGAYRWLARLREEAGRGDLAVLGLGLEVAVATRNYGLAKRQLVALMEVAEGRGDFEGADGYRVQLADLELAPPPYGSGVPLRAIEVLEPVVAAGRADAAVLAGLARAYSAEGERVRVAGLWEGAFKGAVTLAQRREFLEPLARALVLRGDLRGAVDAYAEVIVEEDDPGRRAELVEKQLGLLMPPPGGDIDRGVLEGLVGRYRVLQAGEPLVPFWSETLAAVHEVAGDESAAYEAMKRAYYMVPEARPAHLERLREMAGAAGDRDAALYFQRQLLHAEGEGARAVEWKRLLAMLEGALDLKAAEQARVRLGRMAGGDVDLLVGLLDDYARSGRVLEAAEVADRIFEMRAWEPASAFQAGVFREAAGRLRDAYAAFSVAAEAGASFGREGAPPVGVPHDAEDLDLALQRNEFLRLPERYRLRAGLESTYAKRAVNGHEASVAALLGMPVGRAIPPDGGALRLAAATRAGALAKVLDGDGELGLRETFLVRWSGRVEDEPEAAYSALAASGDVAMAMRIGREAVDAAETEAAYLRFCLGAWRLGDMGALSDWVEARGSDGNGVFREKRLRYALGVLDMLYRIGGAPPESEGVLGFLETVGSRPAVVWKVARAARGGGHLREAVEIGRKAVSERGMLASVYALEIAQWCGEMGERGEMVMMLDRGLGGAEGKQLLGTGSHLKSYKLFSAHLSGLEERVGKLTEIRRELERGGMERKLSDAVPGLYGALSRVELTETNQYIRTPVFYKDEESASYWYEVGQAGEFIDISGFSGAASAFNEAHFELGYGAPRDTNHRGAKFFLQARMLELLRSLRSALPHTRRDLVESFLREPFTQEEFENSSRQLALNGYWSESARIFEKLVRARPHDPDYSEQYRRACDQALETKNVITYLEGIVTGNTPLPERESMAIFVEQLAKMLAMDGDEEALKRYAFNASQRLVSGQIIEGAMTVFERPFLVRLAELYRDRGDYVEALEPLRKVSVIDGADPTATMAFAATLAATGKLAEADSTLRSIILDAGLPREVILEIFQIRAAHLAENFSENRVSLIAVLREAAALDGLGDFTTTAALIKLATTAADAGLTSEAAALLDIARRGSSDPSVRFALATASLEFLLRSPADADSLVRALAACLQQKTRSASELSSFCEILRAYPGPTKRALARVRDIAPPVPAMEMLVSAALTPEDFSVTDALKSPGLDLAILDGAISTLTRVGRPDLAVRLYESVAIGDTRWALRIDPLGYVHALAAQETPESHAALSEFAARARTGRPFAEGYGGFRLAPALDKAGLLDEASGLYEKCARDARYGHGSRMLARSFDRRGFGDFVKNYATFLARNEQCHRAEEFLSWSADITPEAHAVAILSYAQTAFPQVDSLILTSLCSRLQLPSGLTQSVISRAAFESAASSASHENE